MTQSTIVIGLGNPCLGDDGVGWRVVELLERTLGNSRPDISFECLSVGGIHLMERLEGYAKAILIDAVQMEGEPIGVVHRFELGEISSRNCDDAHSVSLQQALATGRALGVKLPDEIEIIGITVIPSFEFSDTLSPPVDASVALAAHEVINLI